MSAAYDPSAWANLLIAAAGVTAILAGLIFVAVALNHQQVLDLPGLPPLAGRAVGVLLALVVECILGLAPRQSAAVLGVETLVLGVVVLAFVVGSVLRRRDGVTVRYRLLLLGMALLSSAPLLFAGPSLMLGRGGGLYWVLANIVTGLAASVYSAWVLLIEIRR